MRRSICLLLFILAGSTGIAQTDSAVTIIPTAHVKAVTGISVSSDGRYLLSSGYDPFSVLWDLETGVPVYDFANYKTHSKTGMFLPNSDKIVTGGGSASGIGVIGTIWDTRSRNILHQLRSEKAYGDNIATNHDGSLIATTGLSGLVEVWETNTGKKINSFTTTLGDGDIYFTRQGKNIIIPRNGVLVYEVSSGKQLLDIKANRTSMMSRCVPSPDSKFVLYAAGKYATIYSLEDGEFVRAFPELSRRISSVDYAPDGSSILLGCTDGTASCFSVSSGNLIHEFKTGNVVGDEMEEIDKSFEGVSGQVMSVKYSPDGKNIFLGMGNRKIHQYNINSGKLIKTLLAPNFIPKYVAVSDDKKSLYARELGSSKTKILSMVDGTVKNIDVIPDVIFEQAMEIPGSKLQLTTLGNLGIYFYDPDSKKYIGQLYFLGERDWFLSYKGGQVYDFSPGGYQYVFSLSNLKTTPIKGKDNPQFKPGTLKEIFK